MDLIWWLVVIAGCVALAGCVAAALLWPERADRPRPRPLANTARLTQLPEYVRAVRLRTISALVSITLLGVALMATVLVAARPTGLPASEGSAEATEPEDIMVCVGGPVTDPAVSETLRHVAEQVGSFGTQRIGLTSANRRIVPLTRDYQYAAAQFSGYAQPPQSQDGAPFMSPVSYTDYSANADDVLAMCLTGFPSFEQTAAQRRSLIYVGPETSDGPALFTADRLRDLAAAAGVQVNVLATTTTGDGLSELARATGGRSYPADSGVTAHLDEIRSHPPAAGAGGPAATRSAETPDVPVVVALIAVTGLALWPLAVRR
ncbi:hypothetical protein ACWDTP_24070 [Mycobacterium sp. NPDC003449]